MKAGQIELVNVDCDGRHKREDERLSFVLEVEMILIIDLGFLPGENRLFCIWLKSL